MLISEITVGKDSKIDSNRKSKAFSRNQINNHISRAVFKAVQMKEGEENASLFQN